MSKIIKSIGRGYRRNILFMLTFLFSINSEAQVLFAITGSIADKKNVPLQAATIFLTGRMNITASDGNGNFSLNNLKAGNYNLVVTMIGYKPVIKDVAILDRDIKLILQLETQPVNLEAVTVKPDKSRLKNLDIFKRQFLGESENALQCKILNSEILTFNLDNKTDILTARSDDILIIKNQALGYQLKYVLLNFEYDQRKNSTIYQGYPSFEELKGTPEEEVQWKINRRLAFLGSIHHFIRSIYNEHCRADGFIVYKIKNRQPFDLANTKKDLIKIDYRQVSFDSLLTIKDEHFKTLHFKDALYTIYTKGKEQVNFKNKNYSLDGMYTDRWLPEGQVSIVTLFGPVSIDDDGLFEPTSNLYFEGYMGWEKIADLVPYEYTPAE
jgi:CarboxypepD_reg-like domain